MPLGLLRSSTRGPVTLENQPQANATGTDWPRGRFRAIGRACRAVLPGQP